MEIKHLQKLLSLAESFKFTPCSLLNQFQQEWKSVTLLCLMLFVIIYDSVHWLICLFRKTLTFLQITTGVIFIIVNIVCSIWNKKAPWRQFVRNFSQVDNILSGISSVTTRRNEYAKIIFIYISVNVYFLSCFILYYLNNSEDLHSVFHILMFFQNYYQLFTCLVIITINISIEFQYYRIIYCLGKGTTHSSVMFHVLNVLEDLCIIMKETVDNISDVFGWQLMIVHGQAIINLLGLLSEVTLAKQHLFGVLQMQQSVFTVSICGNVLSRRHTMR